MSKHRRVPISLTSLRRAASVAKEFNLTLALDPQSGEIEFRSAQGGPTERPPVILDRRSIASNYPLPRGRRKADSKPAEQAVERV
jgi:hypothetical protein